MTVPLPQPKCALCGAPVDMLGGFFRASGKFLPPKDPLARFCNAPLHWACYATWPDRPQFAEKYVAAWALANQKNPFWWHAYQDKNVYVSVNPLPPVEEASVRLCAVGSDIRVSLPKWPAWLANPKRVTPGLCELEQSTLATVLPTLRTRFPDDHALVHAIDAAEKQPARRKKRPSTRSR